MASESEPVLKVTCPECRQKLDVTGIPAFETITCPSCAGSVIIPRGFGELMLEEPIGIGGTASVYRALDLTLDREVAVKILGEDIARDRERVAAFLNEARQAAAVNHPNVIPIYSCGEVGGQPYLVMQYMAGHSLDRRIKAQQGGLPMAATFRHASQAALGLQAAYGHGIIHHDVKPGNILLDADEHVKVGDFGLAEAVRESGGADPDDGARRWATAYYVSPERATTGREDHRGDIYSLGASLYHMLTGQPPFTGENSQQIVYARIEGEPLPPAEVRSDIPRAASAFVLKMLSNSADDRPQSYDEVVDALAGLAGAGESGASGRPSKKSLGDVARAVSARRAAFGPPDGSRPGGRRRPSHPVTPWVNGGLVVGIILLGALFLYGKRVGTGDSRTPDAPAADPPAGASAVSAPGPGTAGAAGTSGGEGAAPAPAVSVGGVAVQADILVQAKVSDASAGAGGGAAPAEGGGAQAGDVGAPARVPAFKTIVMPDLDFGIDDVAGGRGEGEVGGDAPGARPAETTAPPAAPIPGDVLQQRVRPADLNFIAVKEQLLGYLARVPDDARDMEKTRIRQVSVCRPYLIRLMKYVPFASEGAVIRLRSGRNLRGTVPYCNENEIVVRPQSSTELVRLRWSELPIPQYAAFLDYYINIRLTQEGTAGDGSSPEQRDAEVAADCYRVALLCDWYGEDELARTYAERTKQYAPDISQVVDAFIPTRARER